MKWWYVSGFLAHMWVGCGTATVKIKGGTENHASTQSTVDSKIEVILRVDISGCMELPPEYRLACIQAITNSLEDLTDAARILLCTKDLESDSGNEGSDPPLSCRGFLPVEEGGAGT